MMKIIGKDRRGVPIWASVKDEVVKEPVKDTADTTTTNEPKAPIKKKAKPITKKIIGKKKK